MSQEKDLLSYDDDEAIKFILNYLPEEIKAKLTNDDITYIIDLIYEFYENKGFMEDSEDEDVEINEDELIDYVAANAKKAGFKLSEDEIEAIVQGELSYCDSLGMFTETILA